MTDKAPYDLDAALLALARAEREARPRVSERLRARVLMDAAQVSAQVAAEVAAEARTRRSAGAPARHVPAARGVGGGWLGWLRGLDTWAGAAIAAAILFLGIGFGIGYEAGDRLLAEAGFEDMRLAQATEDEALFMAEDAL